MGPCRPDMALFKFLELGLNSKKIDVYNNGMMERDFTYVEDLVKAIDLLIFNVPFAVTDKNRLNHIKNDSLSAVAPHRVVNIGNASPVSLMKFLSTIEKIVNIKLEKNFLPMQQGDVPKTWANIELLKNLTGFTPSTSIEQGISKFFSWYDAYRKEKT